MFKDVWKTLRNLSLVLFKWLMPPNKGLPHDFPGLSLTTRGVFINLNYSPARIWHRFPHLLSFVWLGSGADEKEGGRGGVTTFHASSQGFLLMPEHFTVKWKHCDNLTISGFGLSYEGSSYKNPTGNQALPNLNVWPTIYWWSDCDLILGNSHENNQTMARTGSDWTTVQFSLLTDR